MNNLFTYKIANLYSKDSGQKEDYHRKCDFTFEGVLIPLEFDITLMKLEDAIVVILQNIKAKAALECVRCLKKIEQELEIQDAEREFLFTPPAVIEDETDLYLVNLKLKELNIEEMLRQEILLHFPAFPLCSSLCQGLCSVCGQNRNEKNCGHEQKILPSEEEVKPFSQLKNLIP